MAQEAGVAEGFTARVVRALREQGWAVSADDDADGGLVLEPADGTAQWPVVAQVGPESDVVAVYSVLPEQVPLEHRPAVVNLLAIVNYELQVGSFEIDVDDGDVQLRTSVDLTGVGLDDAQLAALLERLVGANLAAMELWVDALAAVAAGRDPATLLD